MESLFSQVAAPMERQQEPQIAMVAQQEEEPDGINPAATLKQAAHWLYQGGQLNFLRLNELADEYAGRLPEKDDPAAAASVDALVIPPVPFSLTYDDSDLVRLHRIKAKIPEYLLDQSIPRVRKLRKLSHAEYTRDQSEDRWLRPFHLTDWENDIQWDESSESRELDGKSEEDDDENDQFFVSNPVIERGIWTRGIVWDDEEVLDDSDEEAALQAPPSRSNGAFVLAGTNSLPSASVIYGYYGPVPLWIDVNDPSIHVMEDRGGSMRYMGEAEEEAEEEERQRETVKNPEGGSFGPQAPYSKREKERKLQALKIQRLREVGDQFGFDATASILNTRRGDESDDHRRRRVIATPAVDHATYATSHPQPVDLSHQELNLFHRPRLARLGKKHWKVERLVGRRSVYSGRSRNYRGGELLPQMNALKDLVPVEGDFIVVEYVEEFPPILTNIGMGSRIINYYRATEADEAREQLQQSESREVRQARLPRHLQRLQRREAAHTERAIPKFAEGQTVVLEPNDESPFLGDILPGTAQPCLSNNLYRAPLFEHEPNPCDFLLIRSASKDDTYWRCVLREMPKVYVCGQQEPQKAVPIPSKKTTPFQTEWIKLHLAKLLVKAQAAIDLSDAKSLFHSSYYPNATIKKILKELADADANGIKYTKKPESQFPKLDELEKQISVEDVCLNECSAAGEERLEQYGIQDLRVPTLVSRVLDRLVLVHRFRKARAEEARATATALANTAKRELSDRLAQVLEREASRTERFIRIARFLHERLLVTPWNLTSEFVQGHLQATGMLQLTGVGDPSGRGEAFSYLRVSRQKAQRKSMDMKAEFMVSQITGTNKDLRKLSRGEATRVLIGMQCDPQQLKKLQRWDLIHMIREIANKAANEGDNNALTRYARAPKLNHATQLADYKSQCNRIWAYQEAALSAVAPPKDDDEVEEDDEDDIDAWADDLEEQFDKRRASNAAFSSRDEAEDERHLQELRATLAKQADAKARAQAMLSSEDKQPSMQPGHTSGTRPRKAIKRIERIIAKDGTEKVTIRFITDPAEVARVVQAKKELRRKLADDAVRQQRRREGLDDYNMAIKDHKYTISLSSLSKKASMDQGGFEDAEDAVAKTISRGTRRRRGASSAPARLPQAAFAVKLEEVWSHLWGSRVSEPFKYPVDTSKYRDYLQKVSSPMDLDTIRDKIVMFKYANLSEFIDDIHLIETNCIAYNGEAHVLSKQAKELVKLVHQFTRIDVMQDDFKELETELRAKNAALQRTARAIVMPSVRPVAVAAPRVEQKPVPAPSVRPPSTAPTPTPMSAMSTGTPLSFGTATPSISVTMPLTEGIVERKSQEHAMRSSVFAALDSDEEEDEEEEEEEEMEGVGGAEQMSEVASSAAGLLPEMNENSRGGSSDDKASELEVQSQSQSQPMEMESQSEFGVYSGATQAQPPMEAADESSGDEEVVAEG